MNSSQRRKQHRKDKRDFPIGTSVKFEWFGRVCHGIVDSTPNSWREVIVVSRNIDPGIAKRFRRPISILTKV